MLKNNLYNVIESQINEHFIQVFNKFSKKSLSSKEQIITKEQLYIILSTGNVFSQNYKYFISQFDFDNIIAQSLNNNKEITFKTFCLITFCVIELMYKDYFKNNPLNTVKAFLKRFNFKSEALKGNNKKGKNISSKFIGFNKEYFIELIKSNSLEIILEEESIVCIFNNIKITLYEIYKFYVIDLYAKKEEHKIFHSLSKFCVEFKISPFVIKSSEFEIYYNILNQIEIHRDFSFDHFMLMLYHFSILHMIKKEITANLRSDILLTFLNYLEMTKVLCKFRTNITKMNLNLSFLPQFKFKNDITNQYLPKASQPKFLSDNQSLINVNYDDYQNTLENNIGLLKDLFVLYSSISSTTSEFQMSLSQFLKMLIQLNLLTKEYNINTHFNLKTIKSSSIKTLYNHDNSYFLSLNSNKHHSSKSKNKISLNRCLSQINFNKKDNLNNLKEKKIKLTKKEADLIFNTVNTSTIKYLNFERFLICFEAIFQKLEIVNWKNYFFDVIFPLIYKEKKVFLKKTKNISSIISPFQTLGLRRIEVENILKKYFDFFYTKFQNEQTENIEYHQFIAFCKYYCLIPLFTTQEKIKNLFTYLMIKQIEKDKMVTMHSQITFDEFIFTMMYFALDIQNEMTEVQRIYFFLDYFEKIRKENIIVVMGNKIKDSQINYNNLDSYLKEQLYILKELLYE